MRGKKIVRRYFVSVVIIVFSCNTKDNKYDVMEITTTDLKQENILETKGDETRKDLEGVIEDVGNSEKVSDISALDEWEAGPNPKNQPMFDESKVVEFFITFTETEWKKFLQYRENKLKEWVHCSFRFENKEFKDAACRSKGDPENWAQEKKPQLLVRFDLWDANGRFHGLRRVNLDASSIHPASIRNRLGMYLMREAGVDASRCNHARVYKNGVLWGIYENIEQVDREFLEDHFERPDGNLYEDGSKLITNESIGDQSDLFALNDLIANEDLEGDHEDFYQSLEGMLALSRVFREMAGEIVLPTGNNFTNGGINFFWYNDPLSGFVVIPWDFDNIISANAPPDADIWEFWGAVSPNPPSKLRKLINTNQDWREVLVENIIEIRDGPYSKLPERVDFICQQIRDHVAEDPNKVGKIEDFDAECADVKKRILDRITYLKKVIGK